MIRLMTTEPHYLWQADGWPDLHYDSRIAQPLTDARRALGRLEGRLSALGFEIRLQLAADAWTREAIATAAIEGERLDLAAVRSSVARRLGVDVSCGPQAPRNIEGLLDIMGDAVSHAAEPLTHERLHAWQAALFPTGYSGMLPIRTGAYRSHAEPMQIVSGRPGREKVHYEAPPSARVPEDVDRLLRWLDDDRPEDRLVQAALAHLWFETIHPFEDGNGRVGRVLVDLVLARDSGETSRLIRMSERLLERRDDYYGQLERAQHGGVDVTEWVLWFLQQVQAACDAASEAVAATLQKTLFWMEHHAKGLNERQRKVMNLLLDAGPGGFEGGMSTRKYGSIAGTSRATASRELLELQALGLLQQTGAGRSTRYRVDLPGWDA